MTRLIPEKLNVKYIQGTTPDVPLRARARDLISTWEVEPRLAVIVGYVKSDKVASNLMKLSLMKSIPHLVLYINKLTEHACLFNKQEMIRNYTLKREQEEQSGKRHMKTI